MMAVGFLCDECGEPAATVRLISPTGNADEIGGDQWKVEVDGPVPTTHWVLRGLEEIKIAIADRSISALAMINPEYTNFRCPKCNAVYCRKHWQPIEPEMDEGFYDATYGTCPRGHRVMLDD